MKFKCKSCGAPLDVSKGQTVVTCEFCQMKQTVPNADDERKENLYNRANALRTECDFDKAILSYQSILSLFPNEAEAHWGVCLCKYGIEYVDDPTTHKKKPTIHRMSYDSILKDSDYLAALTYADVVAKEEYVSEATEISNIQKNILSISQKETPFDIFICYKETSEDGKRTPDSVMAQEIYSNLTDKGYKVFFSRITLESKLGSMYEPYIFAALNSAKIMLVIGTKVDYFNATWVKNEWKRFIDLMKTHPDRYLIPCYKDMDAYQMPEDFLSFQAQDLSKLGFMQDLLRGIDKIMGRQQISQAAETKIIQTDVNVAALLKRTEILLNDGDFDKADEILEKVLDNDPTNSKAYLFKLLIERRLHTVEDLKDSEDTLENEGNFKKAYEFGNDEEKAKLDSINKFISDRNHEGELEALYNTAMSYKNNNFFAKAKAEFEKISEYRDSKKQALDCDRIIKDGIYDDAIKFKESKHYNAAIRHFQQIQGYKDVEKQIHECEELNKEAVYQEACSLRDKGEFDQASKLFEQIKGYKDAEAQIHECGELKKKNQYQNACSLRDKGQFDEAAKLFGELSDYQDSSFQVQECARLKEDARKEAIYVTCLFKTDRDIYKSRKNLEKACNTLKTIPGYKDSDQLIVKYAGIMKEWDAKLAKEAEEKKRARAKVLKKAKKISLISGGAAVLVTGTLLLTFLCFVPLNRQGKIEKLIDEGDYQQAWNLIRENGSFGDTDNLIAMARAGEAFQSLDYETGISLIYDIGGSVDVNYYGGADGNAQTSQTIKKKYIDNDPSFSGYDFKGWVLSDYTMNAADHHATIDLLAKYTVIQYSISYDLKGGTCSTFLPSQYDTEESIAIPNPTKNGYTFKGWSLSGSNEPVKDYVIPVGSVGNKKLIANWKANTYTVTINANGGKVSKDKVEVTYDSSYKLPVPSRDGYIFDGYTLADGNKVNVSGTWQLDDDCVINANWVARTDIPYTVNYYFEAIDGTYVKQSEMMYGTTNMKATVAAKEVAGFTPIYPSNSVVVKSDGTSQINLYYRRNSYVLSFVTNGGTALEDRTFKFEEPIPKDVVAVREGYTFDGWYTDKEQTDSLSTMPAKNTTAYASYSEETRAWLFQYQETSTSVKITGYSGKLLDDIVVPTYIGGKPVTEIGDDAFSGCTRMTSCSLPKNVSSLGKGAFKNCSDLASVTGCSDLKEIKADTFSGCKQLSVLPDLTKVTKIGDSAFKNCQSLTTIAIGSGLTSIGSHAFEGCLMLLTTPDISNVTSIGDEAFKECGLLSEVGTLDGSAQLGDGIFSGCENIGKLILSFKKNVEEFYVAKLFGKDSLSDGKYYSVVDKDGASYAIPLSLTEIDINNVTELPGYLFYGMKSLEKIQFLSSASLTKIGKYAFAYCSSLKETVNLSMVSQIQEGTFLGCSGIINIDLADQVTSIGEKAFSGCTSLKSVNSDKDGVFNLPDTITFIGDDAFSACSLVEELHLPFVSGAGDDYANDTSYALGHIFGTTSYKDSYSASQRTWSYSAGKGESKNYYIPNSLTKLYVTKGTIDTNALANMTSLTDLVVGDGVKKINQSAFAGCSNLVNLSVPFISKYEETYLGKSYEEESTDYEIKTSTSGSYPWALSGNGYYQSGNTYVSYSSSTMSITFNEAGTFDFQYRVSSRSGDYLIIRLNGEDVVNKISGYYSSYLSKTIQVQAKDVLTLTYSKNSSYSSNDDRAYFKLGKFIVKKKEADVKIESPQVLGNYFEVVTTLIDHYTNTSFDSSFIDFPASEMEGYVHQYSSYSGKSTIKDLSCVKHYYYGIPSTLRSVSVTNQTEIPDYAFNNCSSLISVDVKDVSSIGAGAFRNCSSITEVQGENISSIGSSSFEGCSSLLKTPNLEKIGEIPASAFKGCSSLTDIDFTGVTSIGEHAFEGCDGITEINMQVSDDTVIGKSAFGNCKNITKIKLDFSGNVNSLPIIQFFAQWDDKTSSDDFVSANGPDGKTYSVPSKLNSVEISGDDVIPEYLCYGLPITSFVCTSDTTTMISDNAFAECHNLLSVSIQSQQVTTIGNFAFKACLSLENLDIIFSESVSIGDSAFASCTKLLRLPDMVVNSLGSQAFANCYSLIVTPDLSQLSTIGEFAFQNCSLLSTISLSEQLERIGSDAFSGCSSLASINSDTVGVFNLPDSITYIGNSAFNGCALVQELHLPFVSNADEEIVSDSYSLGRIFSTCAFDGGYLVEQPCYPDASLWDGVLNLGNPVTCNYYVPSGLTKLYVAKGTIETRALANMTSLTDLVVGNEVTKINKSAFAGCSNLVNLSVPFISSYTEERYEPSTNYTISNSSYYAWTLNDGVYKSGNAGASGSSSTMSIIFNEAGTFTFRYRVSSETNYDKLTISLNSNTIVNGISGETSFESMTISINENDMIQITYSKDGSGNVGSDSGYFAIDSFVGESSVVRESPKVLGNYFDIITEEDDTKSGSYDASFVDGNAAEMDGYVCQYSSFTGERTSDGKRSLKNYYYGIPSTLRSVSVTNQTEIPDYAFNNCSSLASIQIDGVTKVGAGSFRNCSSIAGFLLDNFTELGVSAFEGCSALEEMPDLSQITSIPEAAFKGCTSLTKLNLGTIQTIGNNSFEGCSSITNVDLVGVISIGEHAFDGCINLANVTSMSGVQIIGKYAFHDCSSLSDIVLPDALLEIGDGAFFGCSSLSDIHSLENVVSIGDHAFEGCSNLSVLPESKALTSIGNSTFKGCTSLVKIPSYGNLISIGDEAFANLNLLTDIGELQKITYIGEKAFSGCSSLKSLDFPASLTSIGQGAFEDCYSISRVSMPFDATKTFYDIFGSQTEFEGSIAITLHDDSIVYVPQALNSIHIKGNGGLAVYAFENAKHITSITMDEGVLSIGNNAFENCTGLTELDLPESITSLGNDFLRGCSGLLSLKLPFVGSYIGLYFGTYVPEDVTDDFYTAQENSSTYCVPNLLTDLTIKSGEMRLYACANLSKVVTLTVGDSVTRIDQGAFQGFSSLSEITLPFVGRKEDEGEGSSYRCFSHIFGDNGPTSFSSVPQSLKKVTVTRQASIPSYAFYGCKQIEEITIPTETTSIGSYSFCDCAGLKRLNSEKDGVFNIPSGVTDIADHAFYGCSLMQEATLSDDVMSIGSYAFYKCSLVSKFNSKDNGYLVIPSSCETVGSYAFYGMGLIVRADVGDSVTGIDQGAFQGFSSLSEITLPFVGRKEDEGEGSSYRCFSHIFGDNGPTSFSSVPQSLKKVTVTRQASIPSYAFYGCSKIEEIHLVSGYTAGTNAFTNCNATIYTDVVPTSSGVYDNAGAASSYHAGEGTSTDPYQIFTCNEFLYFVQNVNVGDDYDGKYFVLTSNLNFGNKQIPNISKTFKGTFLGNGHIIKNFSLINSEETSVGLFGIVEGEMKNIGFENVNLTISTTDEKSHYFGSIIGELTGSIENVYVKGSLTTSSKKDSYIGGLVGHNNGTIKNCYSNVKITSTSVSGKSYVGGLVGLNDAAMEGSFAIGYASSHGYAQAFSFIGGLVGDVGEKSNIENCYRLKNQALIRFSISGDVTNEYGDAASFDDIFVYSKENWGSDWIYIHDMYPILVKKSGM